MHGAGRTDGGGGIRVRARLHGVVVGAHPLMPPRLIDVARGRRHPEPSRRHAQRHEEPLREECFPRVVSDGFEDVPRQGESGVRVLVLRARGRTRRPRRQAREQQPTAFGRRASEVPQRAPDPARAEVTRRAATVRAEPVQPGVRVAGWANEPRPTRTHDSCSSSIPYDTDAAARTQPYQVDE